MLPVLTADQMGVADHKTIEDVGLPGVVLMENAGAAVARAVREHFAGRRPVVLCGKGNNGGDGFVAARWLMSERPRVFLFAPRDEVLGDARRHLEAFEGSGGQVEEVLSEGEPAWRDCLTAIVHAGVIVDALLGTGLSDLPRGLVGFVIRELTAATSLPPVVAVDLPSGLSSDDGGADWLHLRAALTVTFGAPKYGHVLPPACNHVGRLVVADIGIPVELIRAQACLGVIEDEEIREVFLPRAAGDHKGSFGHVLIVGGAAGKTGAVALAARGALRLGAGLVTAAVPADGLSLLVSQAPVEAMTAALPVTSAGQLAPEALERVLELADERDVVVLGPGLGDDAGTRSLVHALVERCDKPLLLDADGLNALGEQGFEAVAGREAPTIMTPHPGEMARLQGLSTIEVQAQRLKSACALAAESGAHVVLKGFRTLVARPDGQAAVNTSGNPGMATAGTGDVLAGLIGALLARGSDPWAAALAGVHLHGLAGDAAARRVGQEGLVAGDLIEALPGVLGRLLGAPWGPS